MAKQKTNKVKISDVSINLDAIKGTKKQDLPSLGLFENEADYETLWKAMKVPEDVDTQTFVDGLSN